MGIDNTAVILASISFVATVITAIFNFIDKKKKADIEEVKLLITQARELNKQELETVRKINRDLDSRVKEQATELKEQEDEIKNLKLLLDEKTKESLELISKLTLLELTLEKCERNVFELQKKQQ